MAEPVTAYAVFENLCNALDEKGWVYERNDEALSINLIFDNDKNAIIDLRLKVNEQKQNMVLVCPMCKDIPREKRTSVALAVVAANKNIVHGSFDFDYKSGTLGFRLPNAIRSDKVPESEFFHYIVLVSFNTISKYYNKFRKVISQDLPFSEVKKLMAWGQ